MRPGHRNRTGCGMWRCGRSYGPKRLLGLRLVCRIWYTNTSLPFSLKTTRYGKSSNIGMADFLPPELKALRLLTNEREAALQIFEEAQTQALALLVVPDGDRRELTHRLDADVEGITHLPNASRAIRMASSMDTYASSPLSCLRSI